MMKLTTAAAYFNDTLFEDAYGSGEFFRGRLEAYPDNMRDSLATDRRILQVSPKIVMPARRAVVSEEQEWLIGDLAVDMHRGEPLRHKYIVHKADGQALLYTMAQAIKNLTPRAVWSSRLWVKEWREPEEDSRMIGAFNFFFAEGETVEDATLIQYRGRWHISRAAYSSAGGFLISVADELPGSLVLPVSFTSRAYNPKTDKTTDTAINVTGLLIRWQSHFAYFANAAATYEAGDAKVVVHKADVTPKSGDTLSVDGKKFRVVEVADETDVWGLHVRHA